MVGEQPANLVSCLMDMRLEDFWHESDLATFWTPRSWRTRIEDLAKLHKEALESPVRGSSPRTPLGEKHDAGLGSISPRASVSARDGKKRKGKGKSESEEQDEEAGLEDSQAPQ